MNEESPLITRDWLAIERTKLANERTFLAYFRTFLVILGTGVTILKIDVLSELKSYGVLLIILASIVMIIGVYRFVSVSKSIKKHYVK